MPLPDGPLAALPSYRLTEGTGETTDSLWKLPRLVLSPEAVAAYLRHALPPSASLFRGVERLPQPLPLLRRPESSETDEARLTETLRARWWDTVGEYVAHGARDVSLSGGVDSAALCTVSARHAPGRIRAWTMDVHFADETERRHAREVARSAGVELVEVPIPEDSLPEHLEAAVLASELPLINGRAVALFVFHARLRQRGVDTLLSGAGADEVLLGNPGARAGALARVDEDRALAAQVLRPELLEEETPRAPWDAELAPGEPAASEEVRYAAWVLHELLLPPEQRGARAQGVTVHTPYLDERFAHLALGLPEAVLVREGYGKWLFREALRGLVPDAVRQARKTPRYAHTALSSPARARWMELYRSWLSPERMARLGALLPEQPIALLERYTRLSPEAPLASAMDRLLMRLVSLAMLQAHAEVSSLCPEC